MQEISYTELRQFNDMSQKDKKEIPIEIIINTKIDYYRDMPSALNLSPSNFTSVNNINDNDYLRTIFGELPNEIKLTGIFDRMSSIKFIPLPNAPIYQVLPEPTELLDLKAASILFTDVKFEGRKINSAEGQLQAIVPRVLVDPIKRYTFYIPLQPGKEPGENKTGNEENSFGRGGKYTKNKKQKTKNKKQKTKNKKQKTKNKKQKTKKQKKSFTHRILR